MSVGEQLEASSAGKGSISDGGRVKKAILNFHGSSNKIKLLNEAFSSQEYNCKLLADHVKNGYWNHQFAFQNMTMADYLIQVIDPRLQRTAKSLTNETLNELSARSIYLSEEINWLRGSSMPASDAEWNFGNKKCKKADVDRGLSYLSSIGNQCGCGNAAFQPSHSYWVHAYHKNSSTISPNHDRLSESPSLKLARRLAQKNQTLCFAGDSIEFQFYFALKNNLHRVELLHREHFNASIVNVSSYQHPLHYSTNITSYIRKEGYRPPDDYWRLAKEIFETKITFADDPSVEFRFKYFKHYKWAPWLYDQMETCDIIIMNHGLHYFPLDEGGKATKELFGDTTAAIMYLANFTAHSKNRVAIWRSNLPQHFGTPNGQFRKGIAVDSEICVAGNKTTQDSTSIHDRAFSALCDRSTLCGHLTHTCTVNANAVDLFSAYYYYWVAKKLTAELENSKNVKRIDLFSVYRYWVANNLTSELEHAKNIDPNVTGTILTWQLFDLFDVPMWHANGKQHNT